MKWKTKKSIWIFLYIKYRKFWSVSLEHFIERKPLIYEECMRVLLWSYHNIWPLFFWSEHVYDSAENVLRNPSFTGFLWIFLSLPTCLHELLGVIPHKAWFLKIHPTFFHPTTFKSSEKETHYICHCPIFFWKTEPNFCCLLFPLKKIWT